MKPVVLVLAGIVLGCAAATVAPQLPRQAAVAAGETEVQQYCTSTNDYNNVEALNITVKNAAKKGWELVGVYRPGVGGTLYDYVCFKR
jgi:hypothetical protein